MSHDPSAGLRTPDALCDAFRGRFGGQPRLYRAPGRINIIGEHTDYNEGFVLPAALDLHTWAAAAPRDDRRVRAEFEQAGERVDFDLAAIEPAGEATGPEYLKGVAWSLLEEGLELRGCDLLIGGDIPLGGGLSSSASLELLAALALTDGSGIDLERGRMARLCQRAEREFVGVQCGIMDQFAVALSSPGHAMRLDCRSLEFEQVPIPDEARFLIVHSGVSHRLDRAGYNDRPEECRMALERLREDNPTLRSLRDVDEDLLRVAGGSLDDRLYRRCRHVVRENWRVGQACEALQAGDLAAVGALLDESHRSLRDDYEVSCAELDTLVEIARAQPGVLGSRMMGGGFGGCTISLVESADAQSSAQRIARDYGAVLGRDPWMLAAGPAGPVSRWED